MRNTQTPEGIMPAHPHFTFSPSALTAIERATGGKVTADEMREEIERAPDCEMVADRARPQDATIETLTSPDSYGGAVAYTDRPCVVVYGIPVWIMPNGYCRVGHPNAPMVEAEIAVRAIRNRDDRA